MTLAPVPDPSYVRGSWLDLMAPAIELAKAISQTDFVPRAMKNRPDVIAACILYGSEVGLGPMTSLAVISVIEGRPCVSAEAQRALVLAAGHDLWIDSLTATSATWCGRRAGSDQVTRITWNLDDARRAGLAGKQNWRTYPRQMLSARASAELVRAAFADVVRGLRAVEEIEGEEIPALEGAPASPPGAKRRRARAAAVPDAVSADSPPAASAPATARARPPLPSEIDGGGLREVPDADDGEAGDAGAPTTAPPAEPPEPAPLTPEGERLAEEPELMTDAQRRRMHALMREIGLTDRADRLKWTGEVISRPIKSAKDLTAAEADRLLDALEGEKAAVAAIEAGDFDQELPI